MTIHSLEPPLNPLYLPIDQLMAVGEALHDNIIRRLDYVVRPNHEVFRSILSYKDLQDVLGRSSQAYVSIMMLLREVGVEQIGLDEDIYDYFTLPASVWAVLNEVLLRSSWDDMVPHHELCECEVCTYLTECLA